MLLSRPAEKNTEINVDCLSVMLFETHFDEISLKNQKHFIIENVCKSVIWKMP